MYMDEFLMKFWEKVVYVDKTRNFYTYETFD